MFLFFIHHQKNFHLSGPSWDTSIKKISREHNKKISFAWTRLGHFYKKKITTTKKIQL